MSDYENAILSRQESEADDCANCPHKTACNNQCMEIVMGRPLEEVYPQLFRDWRNR